MIFILSGASHSGKTVLAQKMLENTGYPYLSMDHLKMGLIRSGHTKLTPEDDGEMVEFLWPIVREMIKTAIENEQNLIVEGCYVPFDWEEDFDEAYRKEIRYICLILSEAYIQRHMEEIKTHASDVERRLDDSYCSEELLIRDNTYYLKKCREYRQPFILVEDTYDISAEKVLTALQEKLK